MSQYPDLYPAPQRLSAQHRVILRSAVTNATQEQIRDHRLLSWRIAPIPAALLAVAVLVVAQLSASPAAWAAVPQRLDAAATTALGTACAARIEQKHFPIAVARAVATLAEARGSSTAVLLSSPLQVQICLEGATSHFLGVYDVAPLAAGAAGVVDAVAGSRDGGEPVRVIFGQVAADTDTVAVKTADGRSVIGSVSSSGTMAYFLAWWPSHADAISVTVTTSAGATESLFVPDQAPPSPSTRP